MRPAHRLLTRLLAASLPLSLACGGKSDLPEDPDPTGSVKTAGGSAGATSVTGKAGSAGTTAQGGTTATPLPRCSASCSPVCYARGDEPCRAGSSMQDAEAAAVYEKLRCAGERAFFVSSDETSCCYDISFCTEGRPLLVDGAPRVGALIIAEGWSA